MVACGVDEDPALVPGAALDPDVLMDVTKRLQLPVANHDGWRGRAEERCHAQEGLLLSNPN